MIWWLFGLHLAGMLAAGLLGAGSLGKSSIRGALIAAAVAPAVTASWALAQLASPQTPRIHELVWVQELGLSFRFRTDSVAMLMAAIVSGIGVLVFVYAAGYFNPGADGGVRFPVSLLGFSTSMLGLVLADSVWTLFIFWELTSVTSFLLVGHKHVDEAVQAAARRALMITGGGGLALLAGLLVLSDAAGTTSLTDLAPIEGTAGTVAALLLLAAVATKSAQIPFHVWLPGAMAAPTPVSAYLHSATMVKAGILLMAVTGSAFVDVGIWKAAGFALGAASMFWGAIGALRHRDAKLILAWGTISQLGLLVTLLALGSGKAVFAATSILVAHALFKAALFMVVGEIDVRTGTRDIDELNGLAGSMPIATVVAVLAALSMAGAPPLLGFMAKEAAIEAALTLSGTERILAIVAIVGGSVLTVAYTMRFLWTVFGTTPDAPRTTVALWRPLMTIPALILASAGVVGFIAAGWINTTIVGPAATELNAKSSVYKLIRWPGLTTAFIVSMAVLAAGVIVAGLVVRLGARPAPKPVGANAADTLLDQVLNGARHVTALIQHGSLPVYIATMAMVAAAATVPFFTDVSFGHLAAWNHPLQMILAIAISGAAIAGAFVSSRLGAALTLGAVGIGISGLFIMHGAPDLALTQLLIETIIVVGFVTGLGHLGRRFPPTDNTWRNVRVVVSGACGIAVTGALAASTAQPSGRAPIDDLLAESVDTGGGNNVVNVILTDMRALDTLGEVVVLAAVAVGVLALAKTGSSSPKATEATTSPAPAPSGSSS